MKKTFLAAVLAATSISAFAADYFVVVPVPNRAASSGNILVTLNGYSLAAGVVGRPYGGFDFNTVLQVLGDPAYTPGSVRWSVAGGALPSGLTLGADGKLSGTPTTAASSSFQVMAAYKSKAGQQSYQVLVAELVVSLAGATLPGGMAGAAYSYDVKPNLHVTGDPQYSPTLVDWSLIGGALPAGVQLGGDGELTGTPTATGTFPFTLKASYQEGSSSANYSLAVQANLVNNGGYRSWSDGTYAASCQSYLSASAPYVYSGATGDGVYRISVGGATAAVYCNQTANGGGWTLLMKQAQGDGATLQGDTAYWTNGTTLNDTAAGMNMNDGNFVSAMFARMSATQYMLQAANESTVKTYSRAASTPLVAFSNANRTLYEDANGVPQIDPDWFIHATTYPAGTVITQSRFGFNFMETVDVVAGTDLPCGARWGWSSNENPASSPLNGSNDACGGLGGYGSHYGQSWMNNNPGAWQPATLYLWAK